MHYAAKKGFGSGAWGQSCLQGLSRPVSRASPSRAVKTRAELCSSPRWCGQNLESFSEKHWQRGAMWGSLSSKTILSHHKLVSVEEKLNRGIGTTTSSRPEYLPLNYIISTFHIARYSLYLREREKLHSWVFEEAINPFHLALYSKEKLFSNEKNNKEALLPSLLIAHLNSESPKSGWVRQRRLQALSGTRDSANCWDILPPPKQQNPQISDWDPWMTCPESPWDRNHRATCPTSAGALTFCPYPTCPLGAASSSRKYPTDNRMISLGHRAGMSLESSKRGIQTRHPSKIIPNMASLTKNKCEWKEPEF